MKRKAENRTAPGEIVCTVWLCLLFTALPLAVHDAYFDITRTKAVVFWVLAGLLLPAWLIIGGVRREVRLRPRRAGLPGTLFVAFAAAHIFSTLLFRPLPAALFASDNRYQGVLSFALYLPVFLILRRGGRFSPLVRFALLLGASTAALLGILDAWFAATAKDLRAALPFALCALVLLCGGIAARTEGFLLGALAFFVILPLFCRDSSGLRRIPLLWALAAAASLLFTLAMVRRALYRPSELTRLLCAPAPMLAASALAAAAFLLLRRKEDRLVLRAQKVYIILFWATAVAGLVFLILANTLWRDRLPASLASVAVFSRSWGSDRGAEWASFWRMFLAAPLPQKLIGGGAGSLAAWDRAHPLFTDAVTDSAHNEYLHYLLTGGLVGLLSYLALLVCALRKALREPSRGRTALALGCFAYAVQAAVNIAQPFTTPLFFALLALLLSDRAFDDAERRDGGAFFYVALAALALALLIAAAA